MPQYALEGYGTLVKEVDNDVKSKESELLKKLGVPELPVERVLYTARYQGKSDKKDDLTCTDFTIQTTEGWDNLLREAEKRANGGSLQDYDVRLTMKKLYTLNDSQYETITRRKTSSTPAGIDYTQPSDIVKYFS